MGSVYTLLDAGKETDLPPEVAGKRLPAELFPPGFSPELLRKLRPDLLVIAGLAHDEHPQQGHTYSILMAEIGYCSDTNHTIKHMEKQHQHALLQQELLAAGHTVTYHVITLGTTGTIHNNIYKALRDFGVPQEATKTLLTKLSRHATTSATNILRMRRHMEWQDPTMGREPG